MAKDRSGVGREARAVLRQGSLIVRSLRPRRPRTRIDDPRAVVFVHGFMAAGAVFRPLQRKVSRQLGLESIDVTYSPMASFEGAVDTLQRAIAGRIASHTRLTVVAHSLGGLLARWYIQERGGLDRVDQLITLATPHAGTRSARLAPGPLAAALRQESDVVQRIRNNTPMLRSLDHVSLVAGQDRMCTPPSSAADVEGAQVVWIDDLGHNELLFDERVHRVVLSSLSDKSDESSEG